MCLVILTCDPELSLWEALSAIVKLWCVWTGLLFFYPARIWFLQREKSCTLYIAEYPSPKTVPSSSKMNGYEMSEGGRWLKEWWDTYPDISFNLVLKQTIWNTAFKPKQATRHSWVFLGVFCVWVMVAGVCAGGESLLFCGHSLVKISLPSLVCAFTDHPSSSLSALLVWVSLLRSKTFWYHLVYILPSHFH